MFVNFTVGRVVKAEHIFFDIGENVNNARKFCRAIFNFAEFDSETAKFDLKINSPAKFELLLLIVTDEIAGVIDFDFFRADLNFGKFFCGKFVAIQISRRHLRTGNAKFAAHTLRQNSVALIDDKAGAVVKRSPDRNRIIIFSFLRFKTS